MTHCKENNAIEQMMEAIIENGMEGLESAISILINEAMKVERSRVLGAEPWQRSEHRRGYANGYKPRSLSTRVGKLSLRVPQVRGDVTFYPFCAGAGSAQRTCFEVGHCGDVCAGRLYTEGGRGDGKTMRIGCYQQ